MVAACTTVISERRLLEPVAGGTLSQETVARAAPAFTVTRHDIVAADGVRLRAVRLRQSGARTTVIYFGGNGYTIGQFGAWTAYVFAPLGVDVFIVDHRGYGQSQGVPTVASMESDALAIFDYVSALPEVGANRVVVHGQSLGSFVAGHVAAHRFAAGVVLESSATTTEDWVRASTPGFVKPFVRTKISAELKGKGNLSNMTLIDESLLILVGAKDKTTPPRLAEALYAASPLPADRKSLAVIPAAGHNDVMMRAEAIAAYRRFLANLPGQASFDLCPLTCSLVTIHRCPSTTRVF